MKVPHKKSLLWVVLLSIFLLLAMPAVCTAYEPGEPEAALLIEGEGDEPEFAPIMLADSNDFSPEAS